MDITYTPAELGNAVLIVGAALLAALAAFVLICNAVEKITSIRRARRAPDDKQEERIAALEKWKGDVDRKLANDNSHLEAIDAGERVTQRALLALLEHGIDGNNIEQMQDAKKALQNHLIDR